MADYLKIARRFSVKFSKQAVGISRKVLGVVGENLWEQFEPLRRELFYATPGKVKHDPPPPSAGSDEPGQLRDFSGFRVFPYDDGRPLLVWKAPGARTEVEVEVNRGEGFRPLIITQEKRFKDLHEQPPRQTKWHYRAREQGTEEWTFTAAITVPLRRGKMKW